MRAPLPPRCRLGAAGVCLALAGTLVSSSAWAWGNLLLIDAPPAQDTLAVGASAWAVPRSPGSRQQATLMLPALDYERHDGWFVSTDLGVGQNLSGHRDVQAGWRLWPQFGRSTKDATPGLPAFGSSSIAATMPIAVVMGLAMRGAGHSGRALGWISAGGVVALLAALPRWLKVAALSPRVKLAARWCNRETVSRYGGYSPLQNAKAKADCPQG